MWSVFWLWVLSLCLLAPFTWYSCMKEVNNDDFWVKGVTKEERIKSCLKDFGFIMLGVTAITGLFAFAILFLTFE